MAYIYLDPETKKFMSISEEPLPLWGLECKKIKPSLGAVMKIVKENKGVLLNDLDWTDLDNPKVTQQAIDNITSIKKRREIANSMGEYLLRNELTNKVVEKIVSANRYDLLTEDEWRTLETVYDTEVKGVK